MDVALPPCGIYKTTGAIGAIPAGRLVYFHNHGEPGPGLYLPERWTENRARFAAQGQVLADPREVRALEPLAAEGYYRVIAAFECCDKRCKRFEPDTLVQLGYDANATPILFTPELVEGAFTVPTRGVRVDTGRLSAIAQLALPVRATPRAGETLH
jgi:hypothetical protein